MSEAGLQLTAAERLRGAWLSACGLGNAIGLALAASALRTLSPKAGSLPVHAAIGVACGALLGVLQVRVLRRYLASLRVGEWILSSTIGALAGWMLAAALRAIVPGAPPGVEAVLGLCLLGAAQALVLRRHAVSVGSFIACSIGGWAATLPLIFLGASVGALEQPWWSIALVGLATGWLAGVPYGSMTWMSMTSLPVEFGRRGG
ncbi:MAG TPA: hypothetical protein VJV78_42065 [Polyangiales bacterium]|nr:hypothetical protein [Polyangiales bacterium]